MSMTTPLLSICIPTYNRADALGDCLESIVRSNGYDDRIVEIVVSDNQSNDETSVVIQKYANKYKNFIYNRNKENIGGERNFIKVLSIANGRLLKLHNDYCIFTKNGIEDLLKISKSEDERNSYIFVDSRQGFDYKRYDCPDMDTFIKLEFMNLSWISSFVCWKEDFDNLEDKDACLKKQFMQTDWALRLYDKKKSHVIYFCDVFRRNTSKEKRGGFNYISVFSKYSDMFELYFRDGRISQETMKNCYVELLQNMILWYYRLHVKGSRDYTYAKDGNWKTITTFVREKEISKRYYLLFAKVALFDSLQYIGLQKWIRAFLLKRQHKILFPNNKKAF